MILRINKIFLDIFSSALLDIWNKIWSKYDGNSIKTQLKYSNNKYKLKKDLEKVFKIKKKFIKNLFQIQIIYKPNLTKNEPKMNQIWPKSGPNPTQIKFNTVLKKSQKITIIFQPKSD